MTEFGVSPILSRKESAFLQPFFSRQNTTDSNFLDCNQFDILMLTREYSTSADEAKTTPLKQFSVSDFSLYQIPNERSEYNETIWEEDSYSIASEGEEIQNPKRKIIEYGASGGLLTRIR